MTRYILILLGTTRIFKSYDGSGENNSYIQYLFLNVSRGKQSDKNRYELIVDR